MKTTINFGIIVLCLIIDCNAYSTNVNWQNNLVYNSATPLVGSKMTKDNNNKVYYVDASGKINVIDVINPSPNIYSAILSDLSVDPFITVSLNSDLVYANNRIFYRGSNGFLMNFWHDGSNWRNAIVNSTIPVLSGTGITNDEFNRIYYVGTDSKIYQLTLSGFNSWSGGAMPAGLGTVTNSDLIYSGGQVFYTGLNNKLYRYYWNGASWINAILNTNFPLVKSDSELSLDEFGRIHYVATDSKIYQVSYNGTAWDGGPFNLSTSNGIGSPKVVANNGKIFFNDVVKNSISFYNWTSSWNVYDIYYNVSTATNNLRDFIITNNGDVIYCDGSDNWLHILTPSNIVWDNPVLYSGLTAHWNGTLLTDETSISRLKCPVDMKFYPRGTNNQGVVDFAGNASGFFTIKIKVEKTTINNVVTSNTYLIPVASNGSFIGTVNINAELSEYKFSYAFDGQTTFKALADHIVCGDAYIVSGQSNAVAEDKNYYNENNFMSSNPNYGPTSTYGKYARCYGNSGNYTCNAWNYTSWEQMDWTPAKRCNSEVGGLALALQYKIQSNHSIPVCILNNAVGGTSIVQHQLNLSSNPNDAFYFNESAVAANSTSFNGRLLRRIYEAGLENGIKGFVWYQGEQNCTSTVTQGYYKSQFKKMYDDLKVWIPSILKTYLVQIHNQISVNNNRPDVISEDQRTMPSFMPYANIKVISSNGTKYPNCNGIHFTDQGYIEIAEKIYKNVKMDFYGTPYNVGNTAPDIVSANYDMNTAKLTLTFNQNLSTSLSDSPNDIIQAFRLSNGAVLSSPSIVNNTFICTVSNYINLGTISYLGFSSCNSNLSSPGCTNIAQNCSDDSKNWWCPRYLKNDNDISALSFTDFSVTIQTSGPSRINGYPKKDDISNDDVTSKLNLLSNEVYKNISIYPNPSLGKFRIETNKVSLSSIEIYKMDGQIVHKCNATVIDEVEIDLSNLANGIYIMKTVKEVDQKSEFYKIVIDK